MHLAHLDRHGFIRLQIDSILNLAKATFTQRSAYIVFAQPLGHDATKTGWRKGGGWSGTAAGRQAKRRACGVEERVVGGSGENLTACNKSCQGDETYVWWVVGRHKVALADINRNGERAGKES